MEIITLTKENLDTEHICCAISNNKDCQVAAKKAWLRERMDDGLVFQKGNVRGKCFIEYLPAERAWAPVCAPGYMYLDCLWVSGQFKGQGYSSLLLESCIRDCKEKGKEGIAALSSVKKMPFLSDPGFLTHKGFLQADTAQPYYVLYYLPLREGAKPPCFMQQAKTPGISQQGFVLYYSQQCPYPAKYVPLVEDMAVRRHAPFQAVRFETAEQAQNAPAPFTAYSLFYNGVFLTHEILSEKKFEALLTEQGF